MATIPPFNTRSAVLVLGMHSSGTGLLARVLGHLDCGVPTAPEGTDPIKRLNERILNAVGSHWSDWRAMPEDWLQSDAAQPFLVKANAAIGTGIGQADPLVFNDPRMSRLVPFWTSALQSAKITPRALILLRNPVDIAPSLEARNGVTPALTYLSWLHHMLQAEFDTRGRPRAISAYETVVGQWAAEMARIEKLLGMTWPRSIAQARNDVADALPKPAQNILTPDHGFENNPEVPDWVRDTYQILWRWSETGEDPDDFAALDTIRHSLTKAEAAFGPITSAIHGEKNQPDGKALQKETLRADTAETALNENADAHAETVAQLKKKLISLQWELDLASQGQDPDRQFVPQATPQMITTLAVKTDLCVILNAIVNSHNSLISNDNPNLPQAVKDAVLATGLFDVDWYLQANIDVATKAEDPLDHFIRYGIGEGRAPRNPFPASPDNAG